MISVDVGENLLGRWWLPGEENSKLGELSRTENGRLLLRLFEDGSEPFFGIGDSHDSLEVNGGARPLSQDSETLNLIWGVSGKDKLTLCDLDRVSCNSSQGLSYSECRMLLIGEHLESPWLETEVGEYRLGFPSLHCFLGDPELITLTETIRGTTRKEISLCLNSNYSNSEWQSISGNGEVSYAVERDFGSRFLESTPDSYRCSFEEKALLKLKYQNGRSLESVLAEAFDIQNLLTLSFGGEIAWRDLSFRLLGNERSRWIRVVDKRSKLTRKTQESRVARDFVFRAQDVEFSKILGSWLQFSRENRRHLGLLSQLISEPDYHLETRCLLTAVLLESLHQSVFGRNAKILKEAERKARELGSQEEEHVLFIERALDIYFRLPEDLRRSFLPDPSIWACQLKKARNSIAHQALLDPNCARRNLAVQRMTVVLVLLFVLNKNGVPVSLLEQARENNPLFQRAFQQSSQLLPSEP